MNPQNKTLFFIDIVLIILASKLFGIGGTAGALFISFGLHRVWKDVLASKAKKISYSILYVVGGVVLAWGILFALVSGIFHFNPVFGKKSNKEAAYEVPANFAEYKNVSMQVDSLLYPSTWTATTSADKYEVLLKSPSSSGITATLYYFEGDDRIDYKTFAEELSREYKTEPTVTYTETGNEIKNIQGHDWLFVSGSLTNLETGKSIRQIIAVLLFGKDNQNAYKFQLITTESAFDDDQKTFNQVIESLRFFQ